MNIVFLICFTATVIVLWQQSILKTKRKSSWHNLAHFRIRVNLRIMKNNEVISNKIGISINVNQKLCITFTYQKTLT